MSDVAIRVEGVSKLFRLGTSAPYYRFSETVSHAVGAPVRALHSLLHRRPTPTPKPNGHAATEPGQTASSIATERPPAPPGHFWALKDINFEVKRGEVLGIIGRNGAGKSTLLKILSRITEPTEGQITLHGRVGSLLEVGTGFHPELTGRENIFLNGAILGMTRAEIRRKFDEIVAFAEIEQFLDTPVKRYSSGMYMRLAFAVAAHLEPEILVVDEVLAVGDAAFQKKCLGKMSGVAKGGRTVLFVSHQMAAVENLCGSAALMGEGRIQAVGPADRVIQTYLEHTSGGDSDWSALGERLDRQGDGSLQVVGFRLVDHGDQPVQSLRCGRGYQWELQVANRVGKAVSNVELALGVDDPAGARVAHLSMNLIGATPLDLPAEGGVISVRFPRWPLAPGRYGVTIFLTSGGRIVDWIRQAIFVDVDGGDYYGTGKLPPHGSGLLLIDHEMRLKEPVGHVA